MTTVTSQENGISSSRSNVPTSEVNHTALQPYRSGVLEQMPLVPTLLVLVLIEFLGHRLALPAMQPGLLEDPSRGYLIMARFSPFFYHASCLVAVASLCWILIETTKDHRSGPLVWRVLLGLSFCAFLPMATIGSMVSSSLEVTPYASVRRLLPYLNIIFLIVFSLMLVMSWTRPLNLRHKLGMLFFGVPLVMLAIFQQRLLSLSGSHPTPITYNRIRELSFLSDYGSYIAAMAGYWALFLFSPDPLEPDATQSGTDSNKETIQSVEKKNTQTNQANKLTIGEHFTNEPGKAVGELTNSDPNNNDLNDNDLNNNVLNDNGLNNNVPENNVPENNVPKNSSGLSLSLNRRLGSILSALTNPVALMAGLAVTAALGTLMKLKFGVGQRLIDTSMGIALPAPSFTSLFYMGSLFFLVVLLVNMALAGNMERMIAAGISLMVLGGYRLNEPLSYLLPVLGLLCIYKGSVAVKETADPTLTPDYGPPVLEKRWRQYITSVAKKLSSLNPHSSLDVAILDTGNSQVTRIFGDWSTTIIDLRFKKKYRRLSSLEITIGEIPSSKPDWAIHRTRSSPVFLHPGTNHEEENADGVIGAETEFSMLFQVHDKKELSNGILQASDYSDCVSNIFGDVYLWWGIGIKHQLNIETLIEHFWAQLKNGNKQKLPIPLDELISESVTPPSLGELPKIVKLLTLWSERAGIAEHKKEEKIT